MFTPYEECLHKLYSVDNVQRELQNMELLYDALKQPMNNSDTKVIHIAGTNGKGSVSIKIASTLQFAGYRVGLLISPHVSSYRERISIDSVPISEEDVALYLPQILNVCEEQDIPATFFEITTALAFLYFSQKGVDVVVLETGLGGRIDSTNVIKCPTLCVITSIGLEHTDLLGDTVEKIAVEKAGIIKANALVLVGPNVPHAVIRKCAVEKCAEGYYTCDDVLNDDKEVSKAYIDGVEYIDYDVENSRIAKAALKLLIQKSLVSNLQSSGRNFIVTDENIKRGTAKRPICRFEVIKHFATPSTESNNFINVILDVAHNPPALQSLAGKLEIHYPRCKRRFVIGFSSDKDLTKCSQNILSLVPDPYSIHLVEADNIRAAKLEAIFKAEPKLEHSNYDKDNRSVKLQIVLATQLAMKYDEILVVCGSVFIMSEAREALGIIEPRDSKEVVNGQQMYKERLMLEKKID